MKVKFALLVVCLIVKKSDELRNDEFEISYETAVKLASLPLTCYDKEYPNKMDIVYDSAVDLKPPSIHHPVFYGCFDWHSSVHGHWMLASLYKRFPQTELAQNITEVFDAQFQIAKTQMEADFFAKEPLSERAYGWAWFLKLYTELATGESEDQKRWTAALEPLRLQLVELYKNFIPKLAYPVRSGEHPNTAFGLILALEYANEVGDDELAGLIKSNASDFYSKDVQCPLNWEPSGSDFLSPCLQEAELMSLVIPRSDYIAWLENFMPQLFNESFALEPGHVIDRTDGKLVHLDGLNFSRGWNLYSLLSYFASPARENLLHLGDDHLRESMDYVVGGDYMGTHWLASFYLRALQIRERSQQTLER